TDSAGEYTAASRVSSLAIDVISTFRKSTYFMGQLRTEQESFTEENMFIYHYLVTQDGIHFFISLVTKLNPEDTFIVNENEVITLPIRICNIIENDSWWCDLRELVRLLHPFCATLNKLQRDKAHLDHHNKVLSMGQLRNDMNYRRKKTEIDESQKKFHSENYVAPVEESEIQESEISNESFIGDIENEVQWNAVMGWWMEMLNDE
ncbi:2829_t:CDS:2, partial [Entrophospora sp. SA101]